MSAKRLIEISRNINRLDSENYDLNRRIEELEEEEPSHEIKNAIDDYRRTISYNENAIAKLEEEANELSG